MHVPTTGIEVAREQLALGQLVEARDTLERVFRMPPSPGEPDAFRVARKSADALDQALAPRIPGLRITESGLAPNVSVDVTVDGAAIPLAALVAPIKVDPGHHVVVATAPNANAVARKEVDVAEGQTVAVALTLVAAEPAAPSALPLTPETTVPTGQGATSGASVEWLRWGGFGLAAAGVVVGAVTGAMSLSSTNSANKACVSDRCPPSTWGDIDSAHTTATISTVSFIAAGVGAALGVTSFFIGGHSAAAPSTGKHDAPVRARVTAWVGPGSAFIGGTF
jgi:hypothetical protein